MSLTGKATTEQELRGKINGLETIKGYSAYEIALIYGFKGTEEEWLESLKGEKGDKGENGVLDPEIEMQINKNTQDIAYLQDILGVSADDEDVIGLEADFENNTFTRLAGAKGLSAGEDFNKFSMYRDRVRCNVSDDGTINAIYGCNGEPIVLGERYVDEMGSGAPPYEDYDGENTSNFYLEITETPHVTDLGKPIKIHIDDITSGQSFVLNSTLKAGLDAGGDNNFFGTFTDSNGVTCTLTGWLSANSDDGSTVSSFSDTFQFFVYPSITDTLSVKAELYREASYVDDGSNGQVMVYQPKFYYRVVPTKLEKIEDGLGYHIRKANYYISAKPKPFFKLHPAFYDENGKAVEYILYSAYEGSMFDASKNAYVNDNVDVSIAYASGDLLCSVAGNKVISGFKGNLGTKANLEAMANNRGEGWHLETIKATSANQLLMIIELGTMNVQSSIARGITDMSSAYACNCSSLTGSTAELGNATGQATETVSEIDGSETVCTTEGQLSVSYRGIENTWGNIWKHIQGINIWGDGTMGGGQPYVANNFAFNESKNSYNYQPVGFTLANAVGYIKAMGYGNEEFDWLFMPSEIGGTSMLPVGDGAYVSTNLNGYRVALFGGAWYYGNDAGAFYWYCNNGVNACSRIIGGRLVYIPTAK